MPIRGKYPIYIIDDVAELALIPVTYNPFILEVHLDDVPAKIYKYFNGSWQIVAGPSVVESIGDKQDILVSGTNIKTINGSPILGAGNLTVGFSGDMDDIPDGTSFVKTENNYTNSDKAKLDFISVTQAVDLDDIESRVNNLDAAVVLKGVWDASAGTFPGGGTAQAGASYIVSVSGTVDSVVFSVGDRVIAITDNASTATFASNWFKADYTDQVLSVNGQTGAVSLTTANVADSTDKRYLTDAQQTVVGNTSGTNSGNETASTIGAIINGAVSATPNDTDLTTSVDSGVVKKNTWLQIKAFIKTYFDAIYNPKATGTTDGTKYLRDDNTWQPVSVSSSGVLDDRQFSILQSDGTLNAALGVQTWAGTNKTSQDVFTVAANSSYLVEGYLYINTGSTTHTTALAWSLSGATVTDFQYQVTLWSAALNAISTTQSTVHVSGVASKVLNATSTAVYTIIQFSGVMVTGTGGTVTPQINFSANPTGTNLMKRGSWISFKKLGTDLITKSGGWG